MNETPLNERITRALAFMLRHQPEQFDLELDAFGFGDVGEVVRALNERLGEPVDEADLEAAVASGDRQRYEIEDGRIRALYGHSIPVEPGESTKPPETLFVAIPARDVDRAKRFGLRGGRRRFLHLALSEDDARESGRRTGPEYTVLAIRALEAWEEGVNFYDRKSLWLAEEVPTHLLDVGETYDDGFERRPARGRGGRDTDRGRGRRSRGRGRDRGRRDRDGREDRERREPVREREEVPAQRPERSRREERPERGPREERPRRPQRSERRDERPRRAEAPSGAERPKPVPAPAPKTKPAAAVPSDFGAGVDLAEPPRRTEKPAAREARPEPKAAPAPPPEPDLGGFGAGL